MARDLRPESDLQFTAGCGLPVYPQFVEFAAGARRWLAEQMQIPASEVRSDQPLDLGMDRFDVVELATAARDELGFRFTEDDLRLITPEAMPQERTVGSFIHSLFRRRSLL